MPNCLSEWLQAQGLSQPTVCELHSARSGHGACLRTGLIEADSNPVSFTLKRVEKPRERTLTDEELRAIWKATDEAGDYDRIVRLCLLTGCRREEIGGLRRDEVHDEQLKIGTERMKGGVAHEVPLLPAIADTLPVRPGGVFVFGRRGTGFSGWSKAKRALELATAGHCMRPWTLHDLRRTFSTLSLIHI